VAFVLTAAACGYKSLTAVDGGEVRLVSALGFRVEAYNQEYLDAGGTVSQLHADLADRWWTELMTDLRAAGFPADKTDPSRNAEWVYIYLHKPVDGDSSIIEPQRNQPVGGYYDQFKPAFHAPGDYINGPMLGRRPASQALKHEMLHHWCLRTLHNLCMVPGASEWDGHHFAAPDGTDVWIFTWR
jgi:hypothetical protein